MTPTIPPSPNWLTDLTGRRVSDRLAKLVIQYALPIVLVSMATLVDRYVPPLKNESGIPLYFAAIVLAAWFGGWGPSLLATALSALATTYFFENPPGSSAVGWDDVIRVVVFLMVAALISSLTSIRKRAEEALQESHAQLEQRVHERTAELRQSEERFRVLVEGVADYAIVLLDSRGTVVSWNAGAQRIYGYSAPQITGSSFTRFYAEEDERRGEPSAQIGAAAVKGRHEDEGWRRRADGSRFWANVILTSLTDERGEPRGFAQVTRDVTELRQLEREVLEVGEDQQRRFGHDLHDGLGQELTGLAFLAQNLQRRLESSQSAEATGAARIHDLINRALEQTRELAHGFSPVELGPDGLRDALRDLARRAEGLFDIPCTFSDRGETGVEDDSTALHLYRIAQEALNNAFRHGKPSAVRVALEATPHGRVMLTVEDDGVGLPPEGSRQRGMGLRAMLYRARVIGASLDVRSANGKGTIVTCIYHASAIPPAEKEENHAEKAANVRNDPARPSNGNGQSQVAHRAGG